MSLKLLIQMGRCAWKLPPALSMSTCMKIQSPVPTFCTVCQNNNNVTSLSDQHPSLSIQSRQFLGPAYSSPQCTQYSTVAGDEGMLSRMWTGLGFTGKLRYRKSIMSAAGLRLYLCCVELVDHNQFFQALTLEDTFSSWFKVTELHIWMVMVRLSREGKEGKFMRNNIIKFMWEDVDKRAKKLGNEMTLMSRRRGIEILSDQFKSALFAYDEGLLSDDRVLAGALWRNLFQMQCDDPEKLELAVQYVRKQMAHLDKQESAVILTSGLLTFLPLQGEAEDEHRNKQILEEIFRRV